MTSNYVSCFVCALYTVSTMSKQQKSMKIWTLPCRIFGQLSFIMVWTTQHFRISKKVYPTFSRVSPHVMNIIPEMLNSKKMRRGYAEKRIVMEHK